MLEPELRRRLQEFLAEDVPFWDLTGALLPERRVWFSLFVKSEGVLAVPEVFTQTLKLLDPKAAVQFFFREGDDLSPGVIAEGEALAPALLTAERVALNLLSLTCGIAYRARLLKRALEGTGTRVLDTRKTVPGLRTLSKQAFMVGAGAVHRPSLSEAVMIKDNHKRLLKIAEAVKRAKELFPWAKVMVEVESLGELEQAVEAGADWVLLDNFVPSEVAQALEFKDKVILEASGGITPENAKDYAGVHFVSSSWVSRGWVDLSLEILP